MSSEIATLSATAVSLGFIHTLFGPDHYLPFVAMARVGVWSMRKTLTVTILCGIGHIASSAVFGFIGIALGIIVHQLEDAEGARGDIAAWMLTLFGAAYLIWGVVYAIRKRSRQPEVVQESDGDSLSTDGKKPGSLTPWILFVVFLFGPCEVLIPLLMYPAASADVWSVIWVTTLFGLTTLCTMTGLVVLLYLGVAQIKSRWLASYGHALAGFVLAACGGAMLIGL